MQLEKRGMYLPSQADIEETSHGRRGTASLVCLPNAYLALYRLAMEERDAASLSLLHRTWKNLVRPAWKEGYIHSSVWEALRRSVSHGRVRTDQRWQ